MSPFIFLGIAALFVGRKKEDAPAPKQRGPFADFVAPNGRDGNAMVIPIAGTQQRDRFLKPATQATGSGAPPAPPGIFDQPRVMPGSLLKGPPRFGWV